MTTYNITAGNVDFGDYQAKDEASAILAYAKDAGYNSIAEAAAACNKTEDQFISDCDCTEVK